VSREAFERALEALNQRERTSGELAGWLAERGFAPAAIEEAVSRLIEDGAVDDRRFATEFAADKRELRGWGPDRIRDALRERGVEAELVEAALAGDGHESQLERALDLLRSRAERLDDERSRARALAFLARRGYDADVAYDAVRGYEREDQAA
jgi:regulatory protein